jgi:hypothetical protein
MFRARRRLIVLLIASMIGIGAGVAASGIAARSPESATAQEAGGVVEPAWEALVPPVAPVGDSYRM